MPDDDSNGPADDPRPGPLARLAAPRFGLAPRAWQALVVVTLLALVARLVLLGDRVAHFDEGRVAFWTLRYAETGYFEYRYIIHGPFVQHVNSILFPLLGANDFVMRLPVALIGGLLPLSAVLFRDHLRDVEVVGLAVLLAFDPILLYYSRFFRSDVPVAAFMFVAFGLLVRLLATRKPRYLHAATVLAALGFASKENAAVYLLVWMGAGALVVDTALFRSRQYDSGLARLSAGLDRVVETVATVPARVGRTALRVVGHLALAVALFAVLTLVLYAPRAGNTTGIGLLAALADPTLLPAVVDATLADLETGFDYWFGQSSDHGCHEETFVAGYLCYLGRYVATMGTYAVSVSALAVGGFLLERYGRADSRPLVMFASYWGFASVLGYPMGTDVWGAWIVTHAVVPLAIPAAVAFGYVLRFGATALADYRTERADRVGGDGDGRSAAQANGRGRPDGPAEDESVGEAPAEDGAAGEGPTDGGGSSDEDRLADRLPGFDRRLVDVGLAGLLVALVVAGFVVPGLEAVYLDPHTRASDADVVQYAQPSGDLRPALDAMAAVIDDDEGVDVVFYGERYYLADESVVAYPPAADPNNDTGPWFDRLSLPWYTEAFGAEVASVQTVPELEEALADDPPVVVTQPALEGDVELSLDGDYRTFEADLRAPIDGPDPRTTVVIFVAESEDDRDDEPDESIRPSEFSRADARPLPDPPPTDRRWQAPHP